MRKSLSRAKLLCTAAATLVLLCVIGLPGQAQAQSSHVEGATTYIPPGVDKYLYEFTVYNTTPDTDDDDDLEVGPDQVVDWELPLMVGPGRDWSDLVSDITSPTSYPAWSGGPTAAVIEVVEHTWYYEVIDLDGEVYETNNPDFDSTYSEYWGTDSGPYGEYGWTWTKEADPVWVEDNDVYGADPDRWETPDYLIHWYTPDVPEESPKAPILPGQELDGFSFMSDFGQGNAPYMASWLEQDPTIGDPPSPAVGGLPGPSVPLPIAFPMAMIVITGMGGVGYLRRRSTR